MISIIAWILSVSIVALGSILIKPKRVTQIWVLPAIILLGISIISVLVVNLIKSPYEAGKLISTLSMPIIFSYFALVYLLRVKYQYGKIKRIKVIVVFAILILFSATSLLAFYLQKSTITSFQSHFGSRENTDVPDLENYHKELLSKDGEIWGLDFNGLRFGHEGFWKISKETLAKDRAYQVMCESRTDSTEFILIIWIKDIVAPAELVSGFVKDLDANSYSISPISTGSTIDEGKVSFVFSKNYLTNGTGTNSPTLGENVGEIEAFIKGPRTILIMKQTNSRDRLSTLFKTIEESMEFID